MEPSAFKLCVLLTLFVVLTGAINANNDSDLTGPEPEYDEEAIIERIDKMESEVVPPRYDIIVKSYLKTYTIKKREKAESILGRQLMYFPLFEDHFKEQDLPQDLKYLSVVESALQPKAVSRVGATGLWQFMPSTGKYFGLEINNTVDERSDPKRSTEAAAIYLKKLYERFGDWELAIAAYNSGGGRVSRAIKRARSKNFWKLRRFLPRETRNYVPAFIAATYLIHHYEAHDLSPQYPDLDLQLTDMVTVYDSITFYEIAQVTELSLDIIEALNPAYLRGFIPANPKGYYVYLPKRVMPAFKDYLDEKRPDFEARLRVQSIPVYVSKPKDLNESQYEKTTYTVLSNETLAGIAQKSGCSIHQIKAWNKLENDTLSLGQQLIIYVPKKIKRLEILKKIPLLPELARAALPEEIRPMKDYSYPVEQIKWQLVEADGHLCYRLDVRERPFDVALKLPFISYSVLARLNELKGNQALEPGTLLKVKKL